MRIAVAFGSFCDVPTPLTKLNGTNLVGLIISIINGTLLIQKIVIVPATSKQKPTTHRKKLRNTTPKMSAYE
jgi:hypothetical protein